MQLFDSVKLYVFAFALSAFIAVEKLRHLAKGSLSESGTRLDTMSLLLTLVTVCIAVYLAGLLRKLSSRIEQAGIVLVEVLCVLWLANLLVKFGVAWAEIPHSPFVSATIHCAITVLAGVRTFQVVWHRRRTQSA